MKTPQHSVCNRVGPAHLQTKPVRIPGIQRFFAWVA
jgi:hypothetical protein